MVVSIINFFIEYYTTKDEFTRFIMQISGALIFIFVTIIWGGIFWW